MKTKVSVELNAPNVRLKGTYSVGKLPAVAEFFASCVETPKLDHPADRFLSRLQKMSDKERIQMMIDSGVIYPNGDIAEVFREEGWDSPMPISLPLL